MTSTVRVSRPARADFERILRYSRTHFGNAPALRYRKLIELALTHLQDHPNRAGTLPIPDAPGVFEYAIRHSNARLPRTERVGNPAHKLVYEVDAQGQVLVLGIVGTGYPAVQVLKP